MEKNGTTIEIRDRHGDMMFSLCFVQGNASADRPTESSGDPTRATEQKSQSQDYLMTDAQKRFLFRILSEQGMEGDVAHDHLKKLFQVKSLTEVSKFEASQMIERLLSEIKGGG